MKTIIILLSYTLLLLSCGDDSDESSNSQTGAVIVDPYIYNGVLFWDKNKNSLWDEGEPLSGFSDEAGFASFDIVIPAGEIIGQHRAGTTDGFNYPGRLRGISIGEGTVVINPMTTLLANGFSEEQLVSLFAEVGIDLSSDDLFKDPMSNPLLLQAALTLSTGLLQNPKSFGLTPGDVEPGVNGLKMKNNFAQNFLKESALIYEDVIGKIKDSTSLKNISKTSSSFFDYLSRYGTDDFIENGSIDQGEIDQALGVIGQEFDNSQNVLQPIVLLPVVKATPTDSGFSASVLENVWFEPGHYDAIGLRILEAQSRVVTETISNYPTGPLDLRVLFMDTELTDEGLVASFLRKKAVEGFWNYNVNWVFDSTTNQLTLVESLVQKNGEPPENILTREGLPISTTDFLNTLVYRTQKKAFDNATGLSDVKRLIGDGETILTHYGIDWGVDPRNPSPWRTNTSRTNNCLAGENITDDCDSAEASVKYSMIREGLKNHSVEALTQAAELGASPTISFSFLYKKRSLSEPNTEEPIKYIISEISAIAGKIGVTENCPHSSKCLEVSVEGNARAPLEDTENIDFFIGYENFPEDYKVWAVNSVQITETGSGAISFFTNESSSFYKNGFLVVKLKPSTGIIPIPFEYLIIDVAAREGVAASFVKDWMEDGAVKFRYRDFDKIEIKQISTTN